MALVYKYVHVSASARGGSGYPGSTTSSWLDRLGLAKACGHSLLESGASLRLGLD